MLLCFPSNIFPLKGVTRRNIYVPLTDSTFHLGARSNDIAYSNICLTKSLLNVYSAYARRAKALEALSSYHALSADAELS